MPLKPREQQFSEAAWKRFGKAVATARQSHGIPLKAFAYAIASSGKSVARLEKGNIHGNPRTAPPGDYNSERYVLSRMPLIERTLGWERGYGRKLLDDGHPLAAHI